MNRQKLCGARQMVSTVYRCQFFAYRKPVRPTLKRQLIHWKDIKPFTKYEGRMENEAQKRKGHREAME